MKIKKNDKIVVISGKDKGQVGVVREVDKVNSKILVEGINIRTHHIKPTQQNPQGGILKKEHPIHISNVMLNVGTKKDVIATKVSYKVEVNKNGKKEKKRIAKVNDSAI